MSSPYAVQFHLNGYQIQRLADMVDGEIGTPLSLAVYAECPDTENGGVMPAGLYAWYSEYPDEGRTWLPETPEDHMRVDGGGSANDGGEKQ